MFHYFSGTIQDSSAGTFIIANWQGIIVKYLGKKEKWSLYLYPSVDKNDGHIDYIAFDTIDQLVRFKAILKIKGIGAKIAQIIAQRAEWEILKAVQEFDIDYFSALPGIWPKTAKRICIELKTKVEKKDLQMSEDKQQIYKSIIATLKNLWYDPTRIKTYIHQSPYNLDKQHIWDIVKRVIGQYE